jgi:peroxiredoxin Q/BCP
MIEEGRPAPDFELSTDSAEAVRLSELRGKPVILYFYPKDDSRSHSCSRGAVLAPGSSQRRGEYSKVCG